MHLVEDGLVGRALLHGAADLIKVLCSRQLRVAMWVQQTKIGVELPPVISSQLCANTIHGDVQGPPISLQKGSNKALISGDTFLGGVQAKSAQAAAQALAQSRSIKAICSQLQAHFAAADWTGSCSGHPDSKSAMQYNRLPG